MDVKTRMGWTLSLKEPKCFGMQELAPDTLIRGQ